MDILNDLKLKYPYWIDPKIASLVLEKGPEYYQLTYRYADGSEQVESLSFVSFSDSSFFISTVPQEQAKENFIALDVFTGLSTMDFFGDQAESIFDFCLGGNSNSKPFTASGKQFGIYYTVYHDEVGDSSVHFEWFQDAFSLFNFLKFVLPYNYLSDKSNEGADLNELWKWTLHELMELKDYTRYILNVCESIESGKELLDFNSVPYLPNEYHRGLRDIEVRWIGSVKNMHATKSEAFKALLDDIPQNNQSLQEYLDYTVEQLFLYNSICALEFMDIGHAYYIGEIMMDFSNDEERVAYLKEKLAECSGYDHWMTAPGHSKLVVEKATKCYSYYKAFYRKMLQKMLSERKTQKLLKK